MFEQLLKKIALTFERHHIHYMVIGGQAVIFHGEPRLTRDIDVTLSSGPEEIHHVLEAIRDAGLDVLIDDAEGFACETMVVPCVDPGTEIRIDIVLSTSDYERQAIERARRVATQGIQICFATVEDLIIHKIIAGRPRDLEDARSILLKNPSPDIEYIEKWLRRFEDALVQTFVNEFQEILNETQKKK